MSLNLNIENRGVIELPDWLGATSLTLSEVGAVAVLTCMQSQEGELPPEMNERFVCDDMLAAMMSLREKGVLDASVTDEGVIRMSVNLDAVAPASMREEEADEADSSEANTEPTTPES